MHGARPGDLIVTCRIQPHEFFEREGDNLHARANVSFIQATLGAEIEIDGIFHDEKVMVRVPEGCQNEQVIRVKGKGMPRLKSTERGDMYVHITVLIPKKVTKKQRELLEKVAEEFGEDVAAPRSPVAEVARRVQLASMKAPGIELGAFLLLRLFRFRFGYTGCLKRLSTV